MDSPLVSILVPVYRVEGYIEKCARSLFEQTYSNLEFIFVDDASDDGSMDVLKRVLADYPSRAGRVHIVHHDVCKGLAAARNSAVAASSGTFVFHVDSDDWLERDAVALLVEKQQETDSDIVSAEASEDCDGVVTRHLSGGWNLDREALLSGLLSFQTSSTIWRRLIRKSLYTDNGIVCDERGSFGEDFQVFPRLVYYAKRVSGIENCIYTYNTGNTGSITHDLYQSLERQMQLMVSLKVIVTFFLDKEPQWREMANGMLVRQVHARMVNSVKHRSKKVFQFFLKNMNGSDPAYWNLVHWDNPLVRMLESNYYSMRLKRVLLHGG